MSETPTRHVDPLGHVRWELDDGTLHRDDGPALERSNGDSEWYLHGRLHGVDGPAVVKVTGSREWWLHGQRHRGDGPAIVFADGTRSFFLLGRLPRNEDLPRWQELSPEAREIAWGLNTDWTGRLGSLLDAAAALAEGAPATLVGDSVPAP